MGTNPRPLSGNFLCPVRSNLSPKYPNYPPSSAIVPFDAETSSREAVQATIGVYLPTA